MRFERELAVVALTIALATPAGAQLRTSVDVGAASVTYDGGYRVGAMSLTPSLAIDRPQASLFASGTLSRFETGSHSMSGAIGASVLSSATARVRGEVAAVAAGSAPGEGMSAGRLLGQLRLHLLGVGGGLWLGAATGRAGTDSLTQAASAAEAGAWWRSGALLLVAAVEPTRHGDSSWTDVRAGVRFERSVLEIGGTVGMRSGAFATTRAWQAVDATWWMGRFVALNAAVGTYLADPMQSTPGGRYVTVGVRLSTHRSSAEAQAELRRSTRVLLIARPVADRLELRPAAGGRRTILIDAPRARTVELMGDFTEWQVMPLSRGRDGRWMLTVPLAPGTHRFNIRVDGGDWSVPSGVTTITDDFEGVVGILTVK